MPSCSRSILPIDCGAGARQFHERITSEGSRDAIRQRQLAGATNGVEMNHLPASVVEELRARLPKAQFVDAEKVLWRMRAVKTPRELERQKQAYRVAEEIYGEVLSMVQKRAGE